MKERKNKNPIRYLLRDELDIRHKVSNIILLGAIAVQIPTLIVTIAVGTKIYGVIIEIVIMALLGLFLWIINRHYESKLPIIIMCVVLTGITFPIMYFQCGGMHTGMPLWMVFGIVFCFLLLEGPASVLYFIFEILAFIACFFIEFKHPEYVEFLASSKDEILDLVVAFVLTSLITGLVFKFQTASYKKEHEKLVEKEEELVKANEELLKASNAKSDFLANMSHEIRTPINAVLGMDEMIIRDCKDPVILGYAEDIDGAGRQLLTIINDILDFSKIESGKFEIHESEYDLLTLINDCYIMMIGRAEEKKLEFRIKNDPKLPARLYGDEVRIRQIIINFLSNAIKYTEEGYVELVVGMKPFDDNDILLTINVKDTGIGITEEDQKKLFGNFNRIDEKEHRNIEGTGLGLAIAKQLTVMMGGSIGVNSIKGSGSEFYATIPQKPVGDTEAGLFDVGMEARKSLKKTHTPGFTAEDARVLVVDDVKVNLNVVRLLLRDTLVNIDCVESGREALNLLMENKYDVVLMDHMMPEMDGIETLKEARRICKYNESVPMIALTANAISGAEKMYYAAGFAGYITKPIKALDLENMLIKLLPESKVHLK